MKERFWFVSFFGGGEYRKSNLCTLHIHSCELEEVIALALVLLCEYRSVINLMNSIVQLFPSTTAEKLINLMPQIK